VIDTEPQIHLELNDLLDAGVPDAYLRRVHFTDTDGNKMRCYGLFTVPEDDSTDDGHSSDTEDLYIGGGGGCTMMQVMSYHQSAANGDYLVCRPPGGASDGSGDVKVAVEPHLQSGITTQTMPDGTSWAYTAYTEATQQRTATQTAGGSAVLTEYISPPFLTTDVVPVFSCGNSGVTVSSVEVKKVAITGRQWASTT
jgi:hypothetical protein